ncbi:MAG: metalloregulator ArsR/SmtB family transcription factor [Bacteroidota bacterium]
MGITKTEGFDTKTTEMAEVFKIIGHPARLAILEFLAKTPSCICNDVVEELPLAQPTISKHLSELKKVGLIKGSIEGKNICYCIDESRLNDVQEVIESIASTLIEYKNCC